MTKVKLSIDGVGVIHKGTGESKYSNSAIVYRKVREGDDSQYRLSIENTQESENITISDIFITTKKDRTIRTDRYDLYENIDISQKDEITFEIKSIYGEVILLPGEHLWIEINNRGVIDQLPEHNLADHRIETMRKFLHIDINKDAYRYPLLPKIRDVFTPSNVETFRTSKYDTSVWYLEKYFRTGNPEYWKCALSLSRSRISKSLIKNSSNDKYRWRLDSKISPEYECDIGPIFISELSCDNHCILLMMSRLDMLQKMSYSGVWDRGMDLRLASNYLRTLRTYMTCFGWFNIADTGKKFIDHCFSVLDPSELFWPEGDKILNPSRQSVLNAEIYAWMFLHKYGTRHSGRLMQMIEHLIGKTAIFEDVGDTRIVKFVQQCKTDGVNITDQYSNGYINNAWMIPCTYILNKARSRNGKSHSVNIDTIYRLLDLQWEEKSISLDDISGPLMYASRDLYI
jgi:hypothetical protein